MRKFTGFLVLLVLLVMTGVQNKAQAQGTSIGAHAGWNTDRAADNLFAGVQARLGIGMLPIFTQINPSIETYFISGQTNLQADLNLLAAFGLTPMVFAPYAGAGLALQYISEEHGDHVDTDTHFGLNLLAGAQFNPQGALQPFAQVRYTHTFADAGNPLAIMGGVLFRIGY